jgi:hypothetical protein
MNLISVFLYNVLQSVSSAEIVAILEGDVSDIEDADFQDDVEEDLLGSAIRDRVSDERDPTGEIL